jgi:cyclic beta-1,2-glucan synthetase
LDPPYVSQTDGFPGSIADYPPGVRENGGQYTHGGIWFARALIEYGKTELGWEILSGINPVVHCKTSQDVLRYRGEPYVIAADVYTLPGREGYCGWSHYTGSAGWYLKTVTENLFEIHRQGDEICIVPNLPSNRNGCRIRANVEKDILDIRVQRGTQKGTFENGIKVPTIKLNETCHEISIIV